MDKLLAYIATTTDGPTPVYSVTLAIKKESWPLGWLETGKKFWIDHGSIAVASFVTEVQSPLTVVIQINESVGGPSQSIFQAEQEVFPSDEVARAFRGSFISGILGANCIPVTPTATKPISLPLSLLRQASDAPVSIAAKSLAPFIKNGWSFLSASELSTLDSPWPTYFTSEVDALHRFIDRFSSQLGFAETSFVESIKDLYELSTTG